MSRDAFIRDLRAELSKLPAEEVEAAVQYYEEYFDEAGGEHEADVIGALESPKKIAMQIKSDYAVRMLDETPNTTAKKGLSAVWWVIIGICSSPVSIPLAFCMIALLICAVVVVISCIVSLFAVILSAAVGAVVMMALGILAVPVAFSTALLFVGGGLASLGVLAALSTACMIGLKAATRAMIKAMRQRNEKRRMKKMSSVAGQEAWKYKDDVKEAE